MNKLHATRIVFALLVLMPLLAASFGCGIIATPEPVSTATPTTAAKIEPTATVAPTATLAPTIKPTATAAPTTAPTPTIEPTATAGAQEESGDSPMTITECTIDTSSNYVKVTLSYEAARDIEESNLFVIAEVLSEKNDPVLTLNVDADKRLILVNASDQVLLSAQPCEIEAEGNKGTISFDFAKKDYDYDIGGLTGGMFIAIAERAEPENVILAKTTKDGISY
jgi:hypothetical protein